MSAHKRPLYAIFAAACNAALSLLAFNVADDWPSFTPLALCSLVLFGATCWLESANVLFLARTFILGLIGYFPIVIKLLLGQDALFSNYERTTQGFDVAVVMYVTTSLALLSNQVGLSLARGDFKRAAWRGVDDSMSHPAADSRTRADYWRVAAVIGVMLTLYSAYVFVKSYGGTVLAGGYGSGEVDSQDLPFGSVTVFGAVGMFSVFVAGLRGHLWGWKPLFLVLFVVYIVYSQVLMGLRQDAMSVMFGLVVLYGLCARRDVGLKLTYLPAVALGYAFFEVWGVARLELAAGIPISTIVTVAFTDIGASDAVRFGTISPIATTFSNTVFMLQHRTIDFSLGRSYFEWLLRIPPEVLYPDRPKDYALMFEQHGLLSGGGFFELAEVYMNFGLLGALVVPGIISYVLAKAYRFAMKAQTVLSYFILFSFLAVFLRGTWYQTFAFFRAFMVCMILYVVYAVIAQTLRATITGATVRT